MTKRVWVCRTQPGAGQLAAELRQAGFDPWIAPVLAIQPLQPVAPRSEPTLVLVVSMHAARFYLDMPWRARASRVTHIAVGPATANALKGVKNVRTPESADSESVLEMPQVAALDAQDHVWVLAGAAGRELLERELAARCAVTKVELYRRVALEVDASGATIDTIVVSSGEALGPVFRALHGVADVPMIVPSSRVESEARALGFTNVINAHGADADAVIRSLEMYG